MKEDVIKTRLFAHNIDPNINVHPCFLITHAENMKKKVDEYRHHLINQAQVKAFTKKQVKTDIDDFLDTISDNVNTGVLLLDLHQREKQEHFVYFEEYLDMKLRQRGLKFYRSMHQYHEQLNYDFADQLLIASEKLCQENSIHNKKVYANIYFNVGEILNEREDYVSDSIYEYGLEFYSSLKIMFEMSGYEFSNNASKCSVVIEGHYPYYFEKPQLL